MLGHFKVIRGTAGGGHSCHYTTFNLGTTEVDGKQSIWMNQPD